jgi:hypothetical protein
VETADPLGWNCCTKLGDICGDITVVIAGLIAALTALDAEGGTTG